MSRLLRDAWIPSKAGRDARLRLLGKDDPQITQIGPLHQSSQLDTAQVQAVICCREEGRPFDGHGFGDCGVGRAFRGQEAA